MQLTLLDLRAENLPIWEQLRLEEALLRADERNWCLINWGSPPTIVLGISGKVPELVDMELLAREPIPLVRRFSGGGTVVVDNTTCFITFICNSAHTGAACCPQQVHSWSAAIYREALPQLSIRLVENDYVIAENKCGGNAQYLCKERWLHHTSFLWDFDPLMMRYLLQPKKMPAYRQDRPHGAFLSKLCDYIESPHHFTLGIINYLHIKFSLDSLPLSAVKDILLRPHRQTTAFVLV